MAFLRWLPILVFFSFKHSDLIAQKYFVNHYTSENGLPQNSIKGIELDKKGYIWIATENGIARFDGAQFKLYNQFTEPRLKGVRTHLIGKLSDGNIFSKMEGDLYFRVNDSGRMAPFTPTSAVFPEVDRIHYFATSVYENCSRLVTEKKQPAWIIPDLKSNTHFLANSMINNHGYILYFNLKGELIVADSTLTTFIKPKIQGLPISMPAKRNENILRSFLPGNDEIFLRLGNLVARIDIISEGRIAFITPVLEVGNIPDISFFKPIFREATFFVGTMSDGLYIFRKQEFSTVVQKNAGSNIIYGLESAGLDGILTNNGLWRPSSTHFLFDYNSETILKTSTGKFFMNKFPKTPYSTID